MRTEITTGCKILVASQVCFACCVSTSRRRRRRRRCCCCCCRCRRCLAAPCLSGMSSAILANRTCVTASLATIFSRSKRCCCNSLCLALAIFSLTSDMHHLHRASIEADFTRPQCRNLLTPQHDMTMKTTLRETTFVANSRWAIITRLTPLEILCVTWEGTFGPPKTLGKKNILRY